MEVECVVGVNEQVVCPPVPDPEATNVREVWACLIILALALIAGWVLRWKTRHEERIRG